MRKITTIALGVAVALAVGPPAMANRGGGGGFHGGFHGGFAFHGGGFRGPCCFGPRLAFGFGAPAWGWPYYAPYYYPPPVYYAPPPVYYAPPPTGYASPPPGYPPPPYYPPQGYYPPPPPPYR
jgi:hypothetical protein